MADEGLNKVLSAGLRLKESKNQLMQFCWIQKKKNAV